MAHVRVDVLQVALFKEALHHDGFYLGTPEGIQRQKFTIRTVGNLVKMPAQSPLLPGACSLVTEKTPARPACTRC